MTEQEHSQTKLEVILGADGLKRVTEAAVMVLGTGGVGSNCVEALARGGIGHLIIVDRDVVQESNINRQAIAFYSTIGQRKVDVMRAMITDINPRAQVDTFDTFLRTENIEEFLAPYVGKVDYVIDAIDTVSAKLALAEYAGKVGLPLISSMGAANKLHPECFRISDVYDTVNCPLCRTMRKEGRKRGIRKLKVIYSCEQPVKRAAREGAERSERSNLGTASYVPPIMGQMLAGYVIRHIAGLEE